MLTTGETWIRFRIQYYIYAIMFVVFDIETVFLYPWAAGYETYGDPKVLGMFAFTEMVDLPGDPGGGAGRTPGPRAC